MKATTGRDNGMKLHPACELFPPMTTDEFESLKADIERNGQLIPILVDSENRIIDGRNRYLACESLGVEPITELYDGNDSVIEYVVSMNLHRRHLNATQKAVLGSDLKPALAKEAKERQAKNALNNQPQNSQKIDISDKGRADEQAAKLSGSNRQYINDVERIKEKKPELIEKMRADEMSIQDCKRKIKDEKKSIIRLENQRIISEAPTIEQALKTAKFSTIVVDPPWTEDDAGVNDVMCRSKPTYCTMPIDQLRAYPVSQYALDNSHIYLWVTNRTIHLGLELMECWGFRYITKITWCKDKFGTGNYFRGKTEDVLFGVRGSLGLKIKNMGTWFKGIRTTHSKKPDIFYKIVELCSHGPYLEIFARENRKGWVCYGGELDSNEPQSTKPATIPMSNQMAGVA